MTSEQLHDPDQMLAAVHAAVSGRDRIFSAELADALGVSPKTLSLRLWEHFAIRPVMIRIGSSVKRGYFVSDFRSPLQFIAAA